MFTSNAIAAGLDPDSAVAWQLNQQVSDELAVRVLHDYVQAIQNNTVLTPEDIFRADVGTGKGDSLHCPPTTGGAVARPPQKGAAQLDPTSRSPTPTS